VWAERVSIALPSGGRLSLRHKLLRRVGLEYATAALVIPRYPFTFSMILAEATKDVMSKTKNNYSDCWSAAMIHHVVPVPLSEVTR
jgi:hypothetical protein